MRIVDIDEEALAEYGQWPWPRTIVARLVDKLTEQGAAVIAFDVVFAEPDRSSISRMVRDSWPTPIPRRCGSSPRRSRTTTRCWPTPWRSRASSLGFGFDLKGGQAPPKRLHGVAFAGDNPIASSCRCSRHA